jgi:F5/8 type C domain
MPRPIGIGASTAGRQRPCAGPIAVGSVTVVARRWPARRRRYLAGALAATALICASCGGDDGSTAAADDDIDVEVRPFAEVQASDFAFEADPTDPSRAIFRVMTTEPMICAIVWGEDETFGRFNNSLSMNGTGIEQHDVVQPDVTPGVEYLYVVQGTTADGTLYRSPVGSFSIDRAAAPPTTADHGENVALGATVVDVSSEFSDSFGAELAVDGDTSTEWSTSGDGDDGFITIDLSAEHDVTGVEFVTRSMADGTARTTSFMVRVDDGEPVGPFDASTVAEPYVAELDATGRQLRIDVEESTGGNVGAVEIRVFGTPT